MAIFSFNHDTFGKTTNRPAAAARNAAYNAREGETQLAGAQQAQGPSAASNAAYNAREAATFAVRSHVIPAEPQAAEAWFRAQEAGERKNARMSDRFIGALPRELSPAQCIAAVEGFCRSVTGDRVPWHFALHLEFDQKGKPDWNPHAHIIIRDREIETGRRHLYTSAGPKERRQLAEAGINAWSTSDFRKAWQDHMNAALEEAGVAARIDHRSNVARGIVAEPTIHEGRGAQRTTAKGRVPASKEKEAQNRTVLYPLLDSGTRLDFNARVKARNARREMVSAQDNAAVQVTGKAPSGRAPPAMEFRVKPRAAYPGITAARADLAKAREEMRCEHKAEREGLRQLQASETLAHRQWADQHYTTTRQAALDAVGQHFAGKWEAVSKLPKEQQRAATAALKAEQAAAYRAMSERMMAAARAEKDAMWQAIRAQQGQARRDLKDDHKAEVTALAREGLTIARAMPAQRMEMPIVRQRVAQIVTDAEFRATGQTTKRSMQLPADKLWQVEAQNNHCCRDGGRER